MLKIIDVSQWQGTINWPAAKKEIDGVILRLGYGSNETHQDDKCWHYNVTECARLKIPTEAYIYSYAHTADMARSEAAHAIRLLKGTKINRVWYDLEEAKYGTYAKTCMQAFADAVNDAGYEVGLYTYESYYNSYMKGTTKWPIWIAKYSSNAPNIPASYIGWQFTDAAKITGISGRVDCSHWSSTFARETSPESPPKSTQPNVYRLYRKNRHFYTIDESERDALIADGWTPEGIGWKAPKNGHPVYRYVKDRECIWTMSKAERDALNSQGWCKEGIAFRSNTNEAVPIYRLRDPKTLDRVFTKSKNERKALIKSGWNDEGIAFYGRK